MTARPIPTLQGESEERPRRQPLRRGRRDHEQREDEERARDLAGLGDRGAQHDQEHDREKAHGHSVRGPCNVRVERR